MEQSLIFLCLIILIIYFKGIKIVPQQEAWIVERLGKFYQILEPGLNFIIPFIDQIAYRHSLKELPIDVKSQTAITHDNVTITLDGILYIKVIDPKAASYGVADPIYAISQLAQTTMRSEIGRMSMEKTFEERTLLNTKIIHAINEAANSWGMQCMRYEIKDINPPESVLEAMELQVAAERRKRAEILASEATRQSQINIAEAEKCNLVLQSEGAYLDKVNRAKGEAEALLLVSEATAKTIEIIANAIGQKGGENAVALRIAEKYIEAFSNIAKESNTILLPANSHDTAGIVSQALAIFEQLKNKTVSKNK